MSDTTPQTQAIQVANQLIGAAQQVMSIYTLLSTLQGEWTDQGTANIVAALQTAALNTDGSLGAPDGAPNVNHPIDPRIYPVINRAISSNQVVQMKSILDGIVSYINGQALAAQPGARAILNVAVGG